MRRFRALRRTKEIRRATLLLHGWYTEELIAPTTFPTKPREVWWHPSPKNNKVYSLDQAWTTLQKELARATNNRT